MQQQAQRLFLIKQIFILSKQMNHGIRIEYFKGVDMEGLQQMYRDLSEDTSVWLEVFGTTF